MGKCIWRDIPGYEGLYQINKAGEVKSLPRKGSSKINLLKSYICKDGYVKVTLCKDSKLFKTTIHKLLSLTFIPKPVLQVNHINGVKKDNRLKNLEWVTRSENIYHAYRTGLITKPKGEGVSCSKLKENEVVEILKDYKYTTISHRALAKKYNISKSVISLIINNKKWKHVDRSLI